MRQTSSTIEPMVFVPPKPATAEARPVPADSLLTRSDVARMLGVSPTTVTRWAREGRLACCLTLGGHHRFSRRLVEEVRESLSRGIPVLTDPRTRK